MRRFPAVLCGFLSCALCFLVWSVGSDRGAAQSFQLGLPVRCDSAVNCFVLLYPDRDPGPAAVDFDCGRLTYDGHQGTDFAIPDEQTMAQGIPVVAAAPGEVLRVRDGVPDRRVRGDVVPPEVQGQECGNGAVVDHGNGWTTQYCHLRQGSVRVQPGDRLAAGDPIGLIGESGLASFPHVHLQVARNGDIVDPFMGPDAPPGCQGDRRPLWNQPLPYVSTGEIRAGFTTQKPTLDDMWAGKFSETTLARDSAALVFWVHAFGVLEGDVESIQLVDPQGQIATQSRQRIAKSRRLWLRSAGKRALAGPLAPGRWRGQYRLERDGQTLLALEREVLVQ